MWMRERIYNTYGIRKENHDVVCKGCILCFEVCSLSPVLYLVDLDGFVVCKDWFMCVYIHTYIRTYVYRTYEIKSACVCTYVHSLLSRL